MSRFQLFVWVLVSVLWLTACTGRSDKPAPSAQKKESLNVLVLLDLSNRLSVVDGQIEKDQKILEEVMALFEQRQKKRLYITSRDQLRVLVAAQPGVAVVTGDSLAIDMRQFGRGGGRSGNVVGRPGFVAAKEKFEGALSSLYAQASANPYTGADIYTFFCSDYPVNFMRTEPQIKNKIIILTDGYLLFDPPFLAQRPECTYMRKMGQLRQAKENWHAYFEEQNLALCACAGKTYANTEVMLLETAPLNRGTSVYEFDFVAHYWNNWLTGMDIPVSIYPQEDQVSNIRTKIESFLQ